MRNGYLCRTPVPLAREGSGFRLLWIGRAARSRPEPFTRLARALRAHLEGVAAVMKQRRSNAFVKAMNGGCGTGAQNPPHKAMANHQIDSSIGSTKMRSIALILFSFFSAIQYLYGSYFWAADSFTLGNDDAFITYRYAVNLVPSSLTLA